MDWKPIRRIEIQYQRSMRRLLNKFWEEIIFLNITDPFGIVKRLKALGRSRTYGVFAEAIAKSMATGVFKGNARSWREASRKAMRGDVAYKALQKELEGNLGKLIQEQTKRNAELIQTLPADIAINITDYIKSESLKGIRSSDIAKEIQTKFPDHSAARATLIARTETSKTSTALTEARCSSMGIRWYVWRTSEDGRVRSSHSHMDDVLVAWSDPPSPEALIGEKSVGKYHAGNIYNCRCYPEPLTDIDDVSWPCKVYRGGSIIRMTRKQFERMAA